MKSDSKKSDQRRTYTQEFRDKAVRLTVTSGKTVAQISRDLGIGSHRLYEWRREAR
ncbi:MAG: transposase [Candidatus Kapaibacterium sp.]